MCLPCRYRTLAPETAEETYVELSDTEPEDTVGSASTTLPGKGENLCHYFITYLLMPSCSTRTLLDPIHLTCHVQTHTAMIPTTQQNMVLLA